MNGSVSIVIPAFNNGRDIAETMRSVLGQTHRHLEVIVADHGSTDDTVEVLERFAADPRVRILHTEPGGGAARNWNRVMAEATGEYVKLVCGDDLLYPDIVERQLAAFSPGVDMVAAQRDIVDARADIVMNARGLFGIVGRWNGQAALRRAVRSGTNPFGEPAFVMFRRSALPETLWDASKHYLIDLAGYARVLVNGDVVGLEGSGGAFRLSSSQWSVRLTMSQAEETRAFQRELAERHPGMLSAGDLRLGALKASILALGRRLTYARLGERMRPASIAAEATR